MEKEKKRIPLSWLLRRNYYLILYPRMSQSSFFHCKRSEMAEGSEALWGSSLFQGSISMDFFQSSYFKGYTMLSIKYRWTSADKRVFGIFGDQRLLDRQIWKISGLALRRLNRKVADYSLADCNKNVRCPPLPTVTALPVQKHRQDATCHRVKERLREGKAGIICHLHAWRRLEYEVANVLQEMERSFKSSKNPRGICTR